MTTVTGNILDAARAPQSVNVVFRPSPDTFPYVGAGGEVYGTTPIEVSTDPATGAFTVDLVPGNYTMTTSAPTDNYKITVPAAGTYSFDELISTSAPQPYVPSGNGSPEGNIAAPPGYHYWDALNLTDYVKGSGTGAYGWIAEVTNP